MENLKHISSIFTKPRKNVKLVLNVYIDEETNKKAYELRTIMFTDEVRGGDVICRQIFGANLVTRSIYISEESFNFFFYAKETENSIGGDGFNVEVISKSYI